MSAQTPAPFRVGQRVRLRLPCHFGSVLSFTDTVYTVKWDGLGDPELAAVGDLEAALAPAPVTLRDVQARLAARGLSADEAAALIGDVVACALRERKE